MERRARIGEQSGPAEVETRRKAEELPKRRLSSEAGVLWRVVRLSEWRESATEERMVEGWGSETRRWPR